MTPEQKHLLTMANDLSRHAAKEATDKIMQIAALSDSRQLAVMIGIKATKTMLTAFVMSGIEEAGMPRDAAEITATTTFKHLMDHIAEHFDKEEKAEHAHS